MVQDQAKANGQHERPLPLVLLGQLGCSYGKSTILAVYAKYLMAISESARVVICTPSEWIGNQICTHFKFTQEIHLIDKCTGLFLIEF